MKKTIAIIPARGGSKRIPRKNLKLFLGKPAIVYTMETLLKSRLFSTVMVSTDDDEIAELAMQHGAKVPFKRSSATANDHATTTDVLKEVIQTYDSLGENFEGACCIYPVNPFLTEAKLKEGFRLYKTSNTTVFTAVAYSFPVQRSFVKADEGIRLLFPEHLQTRSQDLQKVYHDAAQFYWFNPGQLLKDGQLISETSLFVEIPEMECQDIDTNADWELAELKYQLWKK